MENPKNDVQDSVRSTIEKIHEHAIKNKTLPSIPLKYKEEKKGPYFHYTYNQSIRLTPHLPNPNPPILMRNIIDCTYHDPGDSLFALCNPFKIPVDMTPITRIHLNGMTLNVNPENSTISATILVNYGNHQIAGPISALGTIGVDDCTYIPTDAEKKLRELIMNLAYEELNKRINVAEGWIVEDRLWELPNVSSLHSVLAELHAEPCTLWTLERNLNSNGDTQT